MTFKSRPPFFPNMFIALFLLWKYAFLMSNIGWLKTSYSSKMKKWNVFTFVIINAHKIYISLLFHLDTMSYHSLLLQKNHAFNFTNSIRIVAPAQDICRKVYIDIRRISSIPHLLSIDATISLLSAFVLPKLDYCNSHFFGSPMYLLEWHKKVQITAARLIFQYRKQDHISPLLMSLHWLLINARIEYKLSVICHSLFLGLSLIYLSDLFLVYTPKRNVRSSSDNGILCIPMLRTKTFEHRSFSFAAPTIWNSSPSELRHTDSIQKF